MATNIFDVIVIGAGSGGAAFAKRAAGHGAKVAVIESTHFGGTCVNLGCVPKKIMWWASQVREFVENAHEYGLKPGPESPIDWQYLKSRRDASVARLRKIYQDGLMKSGVTCFDGIASFQSKCPTSTTHQSPDDCWRVNCTDDSNVVTELRGVHVVIASGSQSTKLNVPGEKQYTVGSDGFFDLDKLPGRIAIVGAGYIAVEFAGMLQGLGAKVSLFIRGNTVLRKFDELIANTVTANLEAQGVEIKRNSRIKSFTGDAAGKYIELEDESEKFGPFECIIVAVGRSPRLQGLRLEALEPRLELLETGGVRVDEFQNTNLPRLYALGDVIQKVELTPMAIAAGRKLADRLFLRGYNQARANYDNVPSVIFSHPPVGSVGMSEEMAREKFGSKVLIYTNTAINLYYNVFDVPISAKPKTFIKVVCSMAGADEIVMGIHMIGMGADEAIQGFGFAIGLTKAQLDSVVAVHPSAAEEIVTCQPWGLPHLDNSVLRPLTTSIGEDSEIKEPSSVAEES